MNLIDLDKWFEKDFKLYYTADNLSGSAIDKVFNDTAENSAKDIMLSVYTTGIPLEVMEALKYHGYNIYIRPMFVNPINTRSRHHSLLFEANDGPIKKRNDYLNLYSYCSQGNKNKKVCTHWVIDNNDPNNHSSSMITIIPGDIPEKIKNGTLLGNLKINKSSIILADTNFVCNDPRNYYNHCHISNKFRFYFSITSYLRTEEQIVSEFRPVGFEIHYQQFTIPKILC